MMKNALLALSLALAGPAEAQETAWTFGASLYGWLPGMTTELDTPYGTLESDLSFGDVLSDLDMAFMGAAEASRGRWRLLGDLIYSDLSVSKDAPFGLRFSGARVGVKLTALSGYALYRVTEDPRVSLELGAGLRAFWLDVDLSLRPGEVNADGFNRSDSETWIDPLVAARLEAPLTDKLFATAFADFGGASSDDRSWQALATLGYRFNDRWSARAGYRYMSIERDIDGAATTIDLSGPVIGATYRF